MDNYESNCRTIRLLFGSCLSKINPYTLLWYYRILLPKQKDSSSIKAEFTITAESKCRKICAGAVDYSNEISIWRNRRDLWDLIYKYKKGYPISTTYIRRKAHGLDIISSLTCTEDEAHRTLTIFAASCEKLKPQAPPLSKSS